MNNLSLKKIERVVQLAGKIERDIYHRNLKPGDRYLDTAGAARVLRCDKTDVNRALQLLVKRNVLERRQRLGTFIAPTDPNALRIAMKRIHLISGQRIYIDSELFHSNVMLGLHAALPTVQVQSTRVPELGEEERLREMIDASLKSPEPEGFVLMKSSLLMQRLFAVSGLPTVVWGHPFPWMHGIPFVDRDMAQTGRLCAEYAVRNGCRHVLALMEDQPRPGDDKACDAIRDTLHAAGLPGPALTMRFILPDREIVCNMLGDFLKEHAIEARSSDDRVAVICGNRVMGEMAAEVIREFGLAPRHDVPLVVIEHYGQPRQQKLPYAVTRSELDMQQQGLVIGQMLSEMAVGRKPDPDHVLFSVILETD